VLGGAYGKKDETEVGDLPWWRGWKRVNLSSVFAANEEPKRASTARETRLIKDGMML